MAHTNYPDEEEFLPTQEELDATKTAAQAQPIGSSIGGAAGTTLGAIIGGIALGIPTAGAGALGGATIGGSLGGAIGSAAGGAIGGAVGDSAATKGEQLATDRTVKLTKAQARQAAIDKLYQMGGIG